MSFLLINTLHSSLTCTSEVSGIGIGRVVVEEWEREHEAQGTAGRREGNRGHSLAGSLSNVRTEHPTTQVMIIIVERKSKPFTASNRLLTKSV